MVKAFWNDRFICNGTRGTYGSSRRGNRRLADGLWLMRGIHEDDRDRMLKLRFGS